MPISIPTPSRLLDNQPLVRRVIGWAVLALAAFLVITQVSVMVKKKTGLPDIRHSIYWSKNIQQQAYRNKSGAISSDVASFYLLERQLAGSTVIVDYALANIVWELEHVSRMHAKVTEIAHQPDARWKDLAPKAVHKATLEKQKLYVVPDASATTYVLVPTDADALYLVPESVYRSRVADSSGANLSTP